MIFGYEDTFSEAFKARLEAYTGMFKFIPLKGEHFEEVVYHSILDANPDADIEWTPNGHSVGVDITVDGTKMSLKSCKLPAKDDRPMEYSSFRTTSLPTIDDKIAYLDRSHYHHLLCLSRRERTNGSIKTIHYSLRELIQPFKFSEMVWTEDDVNFIGTHDEGRAVIRKSRSHQLLVFLPLKHTRVISSFDISVDLGRKK